MRNYSLEVNNISKDKFIEYYKALELVYNFDKDWLDADKYSENLYLELARLFYPNSNVKNISNTWTILYNDFRLGSDYIGPSRTLAFKAGYSGSEIFEFFKVARTIGGHMLWPRNGVKGSINTVRGFSSYKDRIDLMLFAIKLWYEKKEDLISIDTIRKVLNDKVTKKWLSIFNNDNNKPFENFINYFKLNAFVNDNYDVYDLTTYDNGNMEILMDDKQTIPKDYMTFKKYVEGNLFCIKKRNNILSTLK